MVMGRFLGLSQAMILVEALSIAHIGAITSCVGVVRSQIVGVGVV